MEYLQSARSEKKKGFDLRKRLAIFDLFEGLFSTWYLVAVVGGDTVSLLPWYVLTLIAPVLGPGQKKRLSPSSAVHGGQHDTKYQYKIPGTST